MWFSKARPSSTQIKLKLYSEYSRGIKASMLPLPYMLQCQKITTLILFIRIPRYTWYTKYTSHSGTHDTVGVISGPVFPYLTEL